MFGRHYARHVLPATLEERYMFKRLVILSAMFTLTFGAMALIAQDASASDPTPVKETGDKMERAEMDEKPSPEDVKGKDVKGKEVKKDAKTNKALPNDQLKMERAEMDEVPVNPNQ